MAKLPRLMQPGPPQFIDPERLADHTDEISGILSIEKMRRLGELISNGQGVVNYVLQFDRDQRERIRISGRFTTRLVMDCQRCLQPVDIDIDRGVNVTLVADEEEAKMLPREVEPLIRGGKELSLSMFFEDELLLALPLAPSHDTHVCHVQSIQSGQTDSERQHPFTVLKELKLKNSTD